MRRVYQVAGTLFVFHILMASMANAGFMYCTSESNIEPTIGEIVHNVIPVDIPRMNSEKDSASLSNLHEQLFDASIDSVQYLSKLPVPIRSLFSEGLFTVDLTNNEISFNDIYLVQRNYASVSLLCSLSFLPSTLKSTLCTCFGADDINDSKLTNKERQSVVSSLTYSSADSSPNPGHWCVSATPVCTSRDMHSYCQVFVDPIRPSCIYIRNSQGISAAQQGDVVSFNLSQYTVAQYIDSWTSATMNVKLSEAIDKQIEEDKHIELQRANRVPKTANTKRNINPRSKSTVDADQLNLDQITENINEIIAKLTDQQTMQRFALLFLQYLLRLLGHIPTYIATACLGFSVLYIAEDLAAHAIFQLICTVVIGVLLFIVAMIYALYSTSVSLTKNTIPYANILLGPVFGWLALVPFSNAVFRSAIYYSIMNFWNNGWFGINWFGKATFFVSALLSVLLARLFKIFQRRERYVTVENGLRDTEIELEIPIGEQVLYYILRFLGMFLLCKSTSNWEVSICLLLGGMNMESIGFYLTTMNMKANATEPQAMNTVEVDHIVGDATARELEKLRLYCATHRGEINAKFSDDMGKHALLNRFADGDYLGIPYSDTRMTRRKEKAVDSSQLSESAKLRNLLSKLLRIVVFVVIIVAVVVVNCLVVSDLK